MDDFYDTTDHDCTTDQNSDYGYEPDHAQHPAELPGYEAHPGHEAHPGYEAHPGHEAQPGYEARHDAGYAYHLHVEYDESGYRSEHQAVESPGYADDGGYTEPSDGHLQGLPADYADLFTHGSAPAADDPAGYDAPSDNAGTDYPGSDEPRTDEPGAVDGLQPAAGVVSK
jgi:hypothetical protein